MKMIPISEKELKFWNEQLKAFEEIKKDLKQEEENFKKERMFLNIFLMPVVGVAIIARLAIRIKYNRGLRMKIFKKIKYKIIECCRIMIDFQILFVSFRLWIDPLYIESEYCLYLSIFDKTVLNILFCRSRFFITKKSKPDKTIYFKLFGFKIIDYSVLTEDLKYISKEQYEKEKAEYEKILKEVTFK